MCCSQVGTKLVALNLSQQTDSADLLGGFQPVDPSHALLPLLEHFQVSILPCTSAVNFGVNLPVFPRDLSEDDYLKVLALHMAACVICCATCSLQSSSIRLMIFSHDYFILENALFCRSW